jgi:hypothetical protein
VGLLKIELMVEVELSYQLLRKYRYPDIIKVKEKAKVTADLAQLSDCSCDSELRSDAPSYSNRKEPHSWIQIESRYVESGRSRCEVREFGLQQGYVDCSKCAGAPDNAVLPESWHLCMVAHAFSP